MPERLPSSPRNLREYLKTTGTSQRDLALRAGVNQSMISMMARGLRSARGKLAIRIHHLTGVPLEVLLAPRPVRKKPK